MKTILFSDNHLWALNHFRGGAIKRFVSLGYKVIVVAPISNNINDDNLIQGVEYINVPLNRTSKNLFYDIRYLYSLYGIYKKCKPDVIFHYTLKPIIFGSIASWFNKIPSVSMFPGVQAFLLEFNSIYNSVARKILKYILKIPEYVIVLNNDDFLFFTSNNLIGKRKLILFKGGEGLDINYYKPNNQIISNNKIIFIMIARVLYSKGYKEFVEAATIVKQKISNTEFILCGEIDKGHFSAVDEKTIQNDHNNGIFIYKGRVNNVIELMQNCDCYVLPSYYSEGMNRSLMEAISIGKPIITTNNKGCKEMVNNNENGFIVEKRNSNSLADAMIKFCLMSKEDRVKMGEKSRDYAVSTFDQEIVIEKYIEIINSIN